MRKTFFPRKAPFPQITLGRAQGSLHRPLDVAAGADRLRRRRTPRERLPSIGWLIAYLVVGIGVFAAAAAWHLLR